jgi:hypothetical protein
MVRPSRPLGRRPDPISEVNMPRTVRMTLLALTLLAAIGGCADTSADDDSTESTEPIVGQIPQLLATATLHLPVEAYLPTTEQNDRLAQAQVSLVRGCLARFGIAYAVTPVPSGQFGPVSLVDRRYGITDIELARDFGYGLGPRDPAHLVRPAPPAIGADGENVLSGRGRSVVNGLAVPSQGCLGEADRSLTPPIQADLRKGSTLQFESFAQSREDTRVTRAFTAWSACMAAAGFPYADPLAAAADPAFSASVDQHQRDVATTDIGCKATTNVVGIWFTVEAAYQARAIAADPTGFAATRAAIQARDQLARTAQS